MPLAYAFMAPSTVRFAPVMYEDSGPVTNATIAASHPHASNDRALWRPSAVTQSPEAGFRFVSIGPGWTLCRANHDRCLVSRRSQSPPRSQFVHCAKLICLRIFLRTVRAARPEVGESGDVLLGGQGGCLVEVDRGHACSLLNSMRSDEVYYCRGVSGPDIGYRGSRPSGAGRAHGHRPSPRSRHRSAVAALDGVAREFSDARYAGASDGASFGDGRVAPGGSV
jgi:hypothetical protein